LKDAENYSTKRYLQDGSQQAGCYRAELLMGIAALNPSYAGAAINTHRIRVGWVERSDTHRYHAA
jgi:hypothetical protein